MPRKIKQLVADLIKAGFARTDGGKGSHRKYKHAKGITIIICGKDGKDAQNYQEKQVAEGIEKANRKGE